MIRLLSSVRTPFVFIVAFFAVLPAWGVPTGSVVLDGSMGTSGALSGPNYQVTAAMGQMRGNNLFQSFSTFNLVSGESATFSGPANIRNILARVTGGSASSINGSINSTIAGANLFLLNPAGVVFGPNAQVNVSGAFTVGTADFVKFSDGGIFYAQLGQNDNLTSAPVSSFGFLGSHPAPVQFFSAILAVNPTLSFNVIAGDILVDNAFISAPSGDLTFFSAASAGEVPFSLASPGAGFAQATNTSFGHVAVQDAAYVDIDGTGGGHVVIRGGRLTVDNSVISSGNSGSVRGGDIAVHADHVAVQNAGLILSTATGSGASGNIAVQAQDVTVDGTTAAGAETGLLNVASASGAGSIDVTATGQVSLINGGQINASTAGIGGNIHVEAGTLVIDDSAGSNQITGISAEAFGGAALGALILVDVAGDASITAGGAISSFSFAPADASDITFHAATLTVDGEGSPFFTGIESEVADTGRIGAITVTVDGALVMQGGGEFSTINFSGATGGDIGVQAGSIEISGSPLDFFSTGIQSMANDAGNSGNLTVITPGAMTIGADGTISTVAFASGNAGTVHVHAGTLTVNDGTIGSTSLATGGVLNTGNAGAVNITVDGLLAIMAGGLVDSGTNSNGHAGDVTVTAAALTIDGTGGGSLFTGITDQSTLGAIGDAGSITVNVAGALTIQDNGDISSNTFSSGHGGNVRVNAGSLTINGDGNSTSPTGISANSNAGATGDGGTVVVDIAGDALLTDAGEVSTTTFTTGNAGSLTLTVGGMLTVRNGGEVSGGTVNAGASGNVLVHAGSILLDGAGNNVSQTGISSQANTGATGAAGSLTVIADGSLVISAGGEISSGTHSLGDGGDVIVQAGSLTIQNSAGVPHLTGITSETDGNSTGDGGDAGSVEVTVAGALAILGGKIDTDTFCLGDAGNVTVHAGSISIDGSADPVGLTGIFSNSNGFLNGAGQGGNAGTVSVTAGSTLSLTGRGAIGAATFTSGAGGSVDVAAGNLLISGNSTGITAQAFGTGPGGDINVIGSSVTVGNGGIITASGLASNAGTITITADKVSLTGNGTISTEAGQNGGDITLHVGNTVYLYYSRITAAAQHNGGNVFIDPQFVVLDHSIISANAALGQGGNITIITNDFLNNLSSITATGETNGSINITSPVLDLSGSLLPLTATLVSDEDRLRENCAASVQHEFSTFTAVGRGGTESSPNELQPDFGVE